MGKSLVECVGPSHQDLGPGLLETLWKVTVAAER
jgi:hypothetical protein